MTKIRMILVLLLFVSGPLATSYAMDKDDKKQWDITQQGIEHLAPDFTLSDIKGNKVSLSDLKGHVVLVVFTTTWCPYCKREIPGLKKMYETYSQKGLEIVAVYIQESQQKVSAFASAYKLPYTILLDTSGMVARAYGIRGVPTKVLIGKDGIIYCRACRSLDIMLNKLFEDK